MDYHYWIGIAAMAVGALTWASKQPWSGAIFKKSPKSWRWVIPVALGALATGCDQYLHGASGWRALEMALGAIAIPIAGHEIGIEGLIAAIKGAKKAEGGNSGSP